MAFLVDRKKAFDTTDHDGLIELYAIGFSKCTDNWFKSFLSNRSVLVNLGNNCQIFDLFKRTYFMDGLICQ